MFWNVFIKQCTMLGKSPNAVAKELNIPSGSITAWTNGVMPRNKTLLRLSEYFGTTVEDLLSQKEKPASGEPQSELDAKFSEIWSGFSEEQKKATIEFMKMFGK